MMQRLLIRDARDNERELLRDLTLAAYQEYAALMPPAHWQTYREDIIETLADPSPAAQLVAEQDGSIVGTALLYPAGTRFIGPDDTTVTLQWPELRLLAVAPAARGQGVGGALVSECVRRARQAGASAITLHSTDFMQTAQRMYERIGFVRVTELDFRPDEEVLVKGYRLALDD